MPVDDIIITTMISMEVHRRYDEMWFRVTNGAFHNSMILTQQGKFEFRLVKINILPYILQEPA